MYFLVDGIYPAWSIFVNTYSHSSDPKKRQFVGAQERVRKDIECAFGILVKRWLILNKPLRGWNMEDLRGLFSTCVILHNMIVEDCYASEYFEIEVGDDSGMALALFSRAKITSRIAAQKGLDLIAARVCAFDMAMQSTFEHFKLKQDLVEHISSL
jgi:Plant transposon protein